MSKPVILSGLRANNDLHLGNYFGALLPMADMARRQAGTYQINLFVPDLHSFTTPIDHGILQEQIMQNLRIFVAAGLPLDNPNIHIYRQSYISAHSELTVILNNFTYFGELSRMTQFKDKANTKQAALRDREDEYGQKEIAVEKSVSAGLFDYPVLMAADILLYGATYVPVGDDQTQHLELTRDIAERMNNKFGKLFVVPKSVKEQHAFFDKDQGLRIKDLADPSKKMSKSSTSDKGIVFLTDNPDIAVSKVMSATTDNLGRINDDSEKQPGIKNLLTIYELLGGELQEFLGHSQYGPFKQALGGRLYTFLTEFQQRLHDVDDSALLDKLIKSEQQMSVQANETLHRVQQAVGLRPA